MSNAVLSEDQKTLLKKGHHSYLHLQILIGMMFVRISPNLLTTSDTLQMSVTNLYNNKKTQQQQLEVREIESWEDKVIRVQDKGSHFIVLNTSDYVEKVEHQINRSLFSRLDEDPSPEFKQKVNNWLNKWPEKIT